MLCGLKWILLTHESTSFRSEFRVQCDGKNILNEFTCKNEDISDDNSIIQEE